MYDIRDNKPYTVRKLADGNCWMTDNLALELTAGTPVEGSLNTSATAYTFTPTSCGTDGTCSLNNNTTYANGTYYYSWYAATAETGTSGQTNTDTSASICPIGWRIPINFTISSDKSWSALTDAYGFTTNGDNNSYTYTSAFESIPFSLARYGYYYRGAQYLNGPQGAFWGSTAYSVTQYAYHFAYDNNYTGPQDYAAKVLAMPVRCVAL